MTLRWRSTSGIAGEETEGRAGRNDAETPPRGGGHAPWAPRSHGRGPRHRGAGASAGSASLRCLVLLVICLRSVCSGSYRGHSTAWATAHLFTAWLTGYVKPIVETAAQKKIPFKTCLPLDRAPGPARAPRLREAVRDTHGRLRRRPMRDTARPAPAFGSRGHRIEGVGAACRTPARRTHDSRAPWDTGTPVITRAARGTAASGTQAPSGARARNRTSPAQDEHGELDPAARRGPAAADDVEIQSRKHRGAGWGLADSGKTAPTAASSETTVWVIQDLLWAHANFSFPKYMYIYKQSHWDFDRDCTEFQQY